MATAAISGKDGSITTASGATEITQFTITEEIQELDATSFTSSGDYEHISGIKKFSGSATGIGTKPASGADAAMVLNSGGNTWTGSATVFTVETGVDVNNRVEHNFTFTFTGSVSIG